MDGAEVLPNDQREILAFRGHAKGLEMACRVHPDVPDDWIGDLSRLRQVIAHLIGNAIRFTAKGEVIVEISNRKLEADHAVSEFAVRDPAIGIPLRHANRSRRQSFQDD